ncbi:hypothetical protein [Pseudomonas sp. EA_35y_Pfl2_R111]|uniref:hypothetical protein n=1 Tax=Pseudomonas sp. EA_35y_Pfl2_R111 TaxID=3088689 RepID=UPI0030D8614D
MTSRKYSHKPSTMSAHTVEEPSQTTPTSDADVLAYMQRQLRSGRVKPSVLVSLTQKNFADVSHERIVQCFNQLDSALLKH